MKIVDYSQNFSDGSQKNTEDPQKNTVDAQEVTEDNMKVKPGRPVFLRFIPSIPRIYPEKPILRRVAFLCLVVFCLPVLFALLLSGVVILGTYWSIKIIFG
jgi:hypothetical protein